MDQDRAFRSCLTKLRKEGILKGPHTFLPFGFNECKVPTYLFTRPRNFDFSSRAYLREHHTSGNITSENLGDGCHVALNAISTRQLAVLEVFPEPVRTELPCR